jgi:PrcB C-terminal
MRSLLAFAAMVLVACGNGQFAPDQRYTASSSGFDQPARLVIRDAGAWAAFWNQLHLTESEVPALPAVDFNRQMVLAAAMGTQRTSGYSIDVEQVSFGSEVLVDVLATSPGRNCVTLQHLTQPVQAVVVSRNEAPVRFQESATVHDC